MQHQKIGKKNHWCPYQIILLERGVRKDFFQHIIVISQFISFSFSSCLLKLMLTKKKSLKIFLSKTIKWEHDSSVQLWIMIPMVIYSQPISTLWEHQFKNAYSLQTCFVLHQSTSHAISHPWEHNSKCACMCGGWWWWSSSSSSSYIIHKQQVKSELWTKCSWMMSMTLGVVMVMEVVMVGSNAKVVTVVVMKVMVMIMLGLFEMGFLVRFDEACMHAHDVHLL